MDDEGREAIGILNKALAEAMIEKDKALRQLDRRDMSDKNYQEVIDEMAREMSLISKNSDSAMKALGQIENAMIAMEKKKCPECNGVGYIIHGWDKHTCSHCEGFGFVWTNGKTATATATSAIEAIYNREGPMNDSQKDRFVGSFDLMAKDVHHNSKDHGWWDSERNMGEQMMLVVTEIAEATEALREGNTESKKIEGFSKLEEELADAVIRIMDMSEGAQLRLSEAILAKHEFNKNREYKHGKAF